MNQPARGEIWLVNWNPARGSEQAGRRPAMVVQTDAANRNPRYPNTIVVAVSTKGKPVATHVKLEPDRLNGLQQTSYAKAEQILTISKARLEKRWGKVSEGAMKSIDEAVRTALSVA